MKVRDAIVRILFVRGWFYLILSALLMLLYNGRNSVSITAWLWPVFMLRFITKQKYLHGLIAGGVTGIVITMIQMKGVIPLSGALYYIIAASMGISLLVPFLTYKLVSSSVKGFISTLVFPLTWTIMEYGNSLASPFGAFGSLAYTQSDNLPLIQLVSVTGIWGIIFLVTWFASVLNWIWENGFDWNKVSKGACVYALVLIAVLLFGGLRLAFYAPGSNPLRAAAISVPNEYQTRFDAQGLVKLINSDPVNFKKSSLKLNEDLHIQEYFLSRTAIEADAGAKLVVWSEGGVALADVAEAAYIKKCSKLARDKKIYLLMTLAVYPESFPDKMPENKNIFIDPNGDIKYEYLKTKLVPGELGIRGDGVIRTVRTEYGNIGSVICYDMDFPAYIRQAGKQQTDFMLVPSSDWREIDPVHSYYAVFRAVENGFSLIRSVSKGTSVAVDYQGRILASEDYYKTNNPSMVCFIPIKGVQTVYSIIGDAFAWLCILLMGILLVYAIRVRISLRKETHAIM